MITLDGRNSSKTTSMLLFSREMSAISLSWDFLVPGDPGLWQLDGRSPQPFSVTSCGCEPLYLKQILPVCSVVVAALTQTASLRFYL